MEEKYRGTQGFTKPRPVCPMDWGFSYIVDGENKVTGQGDWTRLCDLDEGFADAWYTLSERDMFSDAYGIDADEAFAVMQSLRGWVEYHLSLAPEARETMAEGRNDTVGPIVSVHTIVSPIDNQPLVPEFRPADGSERKSDVPSFQGGKPSSGNGWVP